MNFGQKALQVLKTFAPTLALAIGGPVGPFAAAALHAVLGSTDDKSAETAILGATPQQLADLQKADEDFKARMKELGVTEEKMVFDDVANARAREITIHDSTPKILAYALVVGFFATLVVLIFKGTPKDGGGEALLVLLGSLATAFISVIGYYYGSSAGSASKTDALNRIATAKPPA